MRFDGTWSYSYFQENTNPADRDLVYTNRALLDCCRDKVPIGVMRQVSINPQIRYHIFGLALVAGWEGGYFFLEGFSAAGYSHGRGPRAEIEMFASEYEAAPATADTFSPRDILDGRKRTITSIVQRQGQSEFRRMLLENYGGRCAISRCDAPDALGAAHIVPYRGPQTNAPANGLLLRADLHTLFDLGLLAVDTNTMTVVISPSIENTVYREFAGIRLHLPRDENALPSREALDEHRMWAGL